MCTIAQKYLDSPETALEAGCVTHLFLAFFIDNHLHLDVSFVTGLWPRFDSLSISRAPLQAVKSDEDARLWCMLPKITARYM